MRFGFFQNDVTRPQNDVTLPVNLLILLSLWCHRPPRRRWHQKWCHPRPWKWCHLLL